MCLQQIAPSIQCLRYACILYNSMRMNANILIIYVYMCILQTMMHPPYINIQIDRLAEFIANSGTFIFHPHLFHPNMRLLAFFSFAQDLGFLNEPSPGHCPNQAWQQQGHPLGGGHRSWTLLLDHLAPGSCWESLQLLISRPPGAVTSTLWSEHQFG
jgi:hypothetical protein